MMNQNVRVQNEEIRELMNEFSTQIVGFYNNLHTRPVGHPVEKETWEHLEHQQIPEDGRPLKEVYEEMQRDIYSNILLAQHPRSFSCVPSTASLLSWMGDVMTNAYNPHASCKINAPTADFVEKKMIRWMCDRAGYSKEAGGLFVSGGSIANLTAMTAARDAKLTENQRSNAVVYLSDQTHVSAAKGLHMIGFGKNQIRIIATDEAFRMDMDALKEAVARDLQDGRIPFAVIASAGTTNTGSVDPMREIAALCREHDMWMHVDGAFGASALMSEQYRKKLDGIELSDSLSWDAHKWMMQTYGCSVVLVQNQDALVRSFAAHPEYLKDAETSEDNVEFWDLGPELTRPARGLKLWLTLQTLGSKGIGNVIDHGCSLAELTEQILIEEKEWEIISHAQLGIINFRFKGDGTKTEQELDVVNQEIARMITESGFAQVFTTKLKGKKVLRMCTINPETREKDIHDTIEALKETARKVQGSSEK